MSHDPNTSNRGLLLSRDLIFTSKITGTAAMLGARIEAIGGQARAVERLGQGGVRLLLIDLASGDLAGAAAIGAYRAAAPAAHIVAFGSHVDAQSLHDASAAGCDDVMPRSRFVRDLPEILRRHLLS